MRTVAPLFLFCGGLAALTGCHSSGSSMGVTPGGIQDMNYARELIADGMIPASSDYTTEGLFSEHDLPISGRTCDDLLCPRAAAAWVDPLDGSGGQVLLQLGFATDVEVEDFRRPDLNLAVAIDISGSMEGEKMELSKKALHEIVDQLGPRDTMSLVTYGTSAKVRQKPMTMNSQGADAMRDAIDTLSSRGSTAMEAGLRLAYKQIERTSPAKGVSERVMIITDAQPNVGATTSSEFMDIARKHAKDDVGLTVWGVGLDLGAELTAELAKVRGANAFFFADVDGMNERVRDEFDLWVTPVAYDLEVSADPHDDLRIVRSWGAPTDAGLQRVWMGASTLFFSKNQGGMGISLKQLGGRPIRAEDGSLDVAGLQLSWLPVGGDERVEAELLARWEGGAVLADGWTLAEDLGVFKMAGLTDEIGALDAAALWCEGEMELELAEARVGEAQLRLASKAAQLGDADLQVEADLMAQLLTNLQSAGQCNGSAGYDTGI